ncbi:2-nitropropane dioxygenase NPD (modular protein) [uncultured delta proteobacterium]|uniref:2-nitropropane dioxygenase NPD (Modular protein) n=1 Tax=uncultured delta proteobacterium TaxID=34034 RepID=A0A212IW04_9DELT|nr:2-nitropropane dioxygenase NPD (modular protein) [uncultured delta proteobacterium]
MAFPSLQIGDLVVRKPIVQGGMGVGISLHRLASAVANEGGVGVIAAAMIGMKEPDVAVNPHEANIRALRNEIRKARSLTDGVLGVNIMCVLTDFSQLVKTSIEEGIDVIFAGAGLPMDLPKYLQETRESLQKECNTKLVPIVSSARAATLICKKWLQRYGVLPDAFVVEGPKAGGHLGFKPEDIFDPAHSLENAVPETVAALKEFEEKKGCRIPVIAAGGVFTGGDIKKVMDLGAAGVQMGTRFVATHECDADIRFKESYVNASEEDITIIKSPVGLPGRAIKGKFLDALADGKKNFRCIFQCISTCDPQKSPYCIASALLNAMKGNLDRGFAFSGANAYRVTSIISVHELMTGLQKEFETTAETAKAGFESMVEATRAGIDHAMAATRVTLDQAVESTMAGLEKTMEATRAGFNQTMEATKASFNHTVEATKASLDQAVGATRAGIDQAVVNTRASLDQAVETTRIGLEKTFRAPKPLTQED